MLTRAARASRQCCVSRLLATAAVTVAPPAELQALSWPSQLEELKVDWLVEQLQRGENALAQGQGVRRLTPSLLRGGPLSSVHRLALECEDGSHLSVVLKTAPLGVGRSLASANKHFEREVGFYKAMNTERTPLSLPFVYFAGHDARSGRAALLLSDCERGGWARADAEGVLSAEAAPTVVRSLAAHHAKFWNSPLIPLWKWLPAMSAPLVRDFEPALCAAALPLALERFGAELPPILVKALPGLPSAAAGAVLRRLASAPRTLLHGNARASKVFIQSPLDGCEAQGAQEDVRFVDWGDAVAGRGPYDIACLLACMDPEQRAEGEHSLLAEYHDGLSEGGVTAYSMYDAWEDYRAGVVYALVGAVAAAGAPGLEADAQAWEEARLRLHRTAQAAHDLGCTQLMLPE